MLKRVLSRILFVLIAAGFACGAQGRNFEIIYSIEQSRAPLLDDIKKGDLVIIDIENTIATPKSAMFSASSNDRRFIKMLQERSEKYPNLNKPIARWFLSRQLELVESGWPQLIEDIKKKGALVVAMTKIYDGLPKFIKNPEGELARDMNQLGVKFSEQVLSKKYFSLSSDKDDRAYFYEGILFTGSLGRQKALENFLRVTVLFPGKTFIISTYKPTLRSLRNYLNKVNLKSEPILYKGWSEKKKDVDPALVKFQQQLLLNKNIWLEDDQAKAKMQEIQNKKK